MLLTHLFSRQFPQMSPFSPWSEWTGASDASAEKDGACWIGGWLSNQSHPAKDEVLWFQYQVLQPTHPWAFKRNDPQKRIAALELCGTLFLALMLMDKQPAASCRLHLPLISDNQGNVFSILNNATGTEDAYGGDLDGTGLSTISSGTHARSIPFVMTIHPNPKGFCPTLKVDLSPFLAKLVLIPKILESGTGPLWTDSVTHP